MKGLGTANNGQPFTSTPKSMKTEGFQLDALFLKIIFQFQLKWQVLDYWRCLILLLAVLTTATGARFLTIKE